MMSDTCTTLLAQHGAVQVRVTSECRPSEPNWLAGAVCGDVRRPVALRARRLGSGKTAVDAHTIRQRERHIAIAARRWHVRACRNPDFIAVVGLRQRRLQFACGRPAVAIAARTRLDTKDHGGDITQIGAGAIFRQIGPQTKGDLAARLRGVTLQHQIREERLQPGRIEARDRHVSVGELEFAQELNL
jgi:hypothetical protein